MESTSHLVDHVSTVMVRPLVDSTKTEMSPGHYAPSKPSAQLSYPLYSTKTEMGSGQCPNKLQIFFFLTFGHFGM